MANVKFIICSAIPTVEEIEPLSLYFVKKETENFARLFKSTLAGDGLIPFANPEGNASGILYIGATQPAVGKGFQFWYDNTNLYVNVPINSIDNWVDVNGSSKWFTGSGEPSVSNGKNGDLYLEDDGSVWNKENGVWVVSMINLKGQGAYFRILQQSNIASLATETAEPNEIILIEGYGFYKHQASSTATADGQFVLASSSGRWHIEALGLSLVDTVVRNILAE